MYSIKFTSHAEKQYNKLPLEIRKRIKESTNKIKCNPYDEVKKLEGLTKFPIYSLRVGDYRVIMRIKDKELTILLIDIGNRKNVYRKY